MTTTQTPASSPSSVTTPQSTIATQAPIKVEGPKKIEPKFLSCEGKTGKKLNSDGDIVVKTPKGKNVIYADTKGKVFATENDYIRCVKNAKRYGIVNCTDKTDMILNSKGKKLGFYPRGTVLYASSEYGNIYVSSKTAVNCTQDQNLLQKINL